MTNLNPEKTMERFQIVEDAAAIVLARGVYRQVKVFRRGKDLYAANGSGFIRLYRGGSTSLPNVAWKDIDLCGARMGERNLGLTISTSIAVTAE